MKLSKVGLLLLGSMTPAACSIGTEPDADTASSKVVTETAQSIYVAGCAADATPQFCELVHSAPITTMGLLEVQYSVGAGHCSSIRVHYYLDGIPIYTSPFLGWPGGPVLGGLSTGFIDLGPVAPGGHLVEVRAEGQVGGCNHGHLSAWAGELRLRTGGEENLPPDCSNAVSASSTLWPPNHAMIPIPIGDVVDPDSGDLPAIEITSIFQDEPVNTLGSGSTEVDGDGVGTGAARVRAERAGSKKVPGDGRVYHVGFVATDAAGATCSGAVTVCVPHDPSHGGLCSDGGPHFDSTVP